MHPAHPPLLFGGGAGESVCAGEGALDDGVGVVVMADPFMSISGTSLRTSFASGIGPLPGCTSPSFVAATSCCGACTFAGGPPHTPR